MDLLKPEVEDVFLLTKHMGLHQPPGLFKQCLFVHEVATDHAVLWLLPVPDEGADAVDLSLRLFGFLLAFPQGAQAPPQLLFSLPRLLPPLRDALCAGPRPAILDVPPD